MLFNKLKVDLMNIEIMLKKRQTQHSMNNIDVLNIKESLLKIREREREGGRGRERERERKEIKIYNVHIH